MAKLIRLSAPGASGAAGSGSTPSALQITPPASQAQQGVAYAGAFGAAGGVLPYTFSIVSGSLFGTGLSLNTSTGRISGTPLNAGVLSFTGRVTDAASTTADVATSINVAQPSGAAILIAVTGAVGRDIGHSTDSVDVQTRLVSFSVGCALSFPSTPTEYVTGWLSQDGGSNWIGMGPFLFTSNGQEVTFGRLRPSASATWKVAAKAGIYNGDPAVLLPTASLPSGTVFSAGFTVAALAAPAGGLGTNPTPVTGAAGSWPYNQVTSDGSQYWSISALNVNVSSAYLDPNVFVITSTFQDLDASHNPIGPEHIYGGVVPVNGSINIGRLEGDYGTDGWSYIRTGNIAYVRWKLYAISRADQSAAAWQNPAASTLQTDPGSGAGYVDILVAAGGALPPGRVLVNLRADASVWGGGGVQVHPTTGRVVTPNSNPGASIIQDASFQFSSAGALGGGPSGGTAPGWGWSVGSNTALIEIKTDGGNSDANYCRITGANTAITQTISVQGGARFYVQAALRSSNAAGPAHSLSLVVEWLDSAQASIAPYWIGVGSASGYLSAWTNSAISGYLAAPTGAAFAIIRLITSSVDTGYWDIDDVLVQPVINQQANGVTVNTDQTTTVHGNAVFRATSATAEAVYGHDYAHLQNAAGSSLFIDPGGIQVFSSAGIESFFIASNSDQQNQILIRAGDSGPRIQVKVSGTTFTGFNGTIQDNLGVNHTVKNGLIVS